MEFCACTLLGPEGSGWLSSGGWVGSLDLFLMPGCVGEGYRPYFENYTVDASIFDTGLKILHQKDLRECFRVFL